MFFFWKDFFYSICVNFFSGKMPKFKEYNISKIVMCVDVSIVTIDIFKLILSKIMLQSKNCISLTYYRFLSAHLLIKTLFWLSVYIVYYNALFYHFNLAFSKSQLHVANDIFQKSTNKESGLICSLFYYSLLYINAFFVQLLNKSYQSYYNSDI